MKAKPTKTTNQIHFTDLDPMRFEDLCLALLHRYKKWVDIRHYGRTGGDSGVDIFAREENVDGADRIWLVQCRRYSKATQKTLVQAVDDALSMAETQPYVLLVIVSCNVRRKAQEHFDEYAKEKGVKIPLLWTASVLEAKLYDERPDLLFAYFGVSNSKKNLNPETRIKRNIGLKKKMQRDFLTEKVSHEEAIKCPSSRFGDSTAIIRSVEDKSYPEMDESPSGISPWFKVELFDFYHNGLQVILGLREAIFGHGGRWAILNDDQSYDQKKFVRNKVFMIGCIPYSDIVEYDMMGDECYPQPHIYCRFCESDGPYEKICYRICHDGYPAGLDPEAQFELP